MSGRPEDLVHSYVTDLNGVAEQAAPTQPTASSGSSSHLDNPYKGGRITRLNNHWTPRNYSGDQSIQETWPLMHARIRDLVRNDSILTKAKKALNRLTIGTGIQPYSNASTLTDDAGREEELERFEIVADTWFERWAIDEADIEGEATFWEMQQTSFDDMVEVGNCIWLRVMDNRPGRRIPLAYQLIEWEQLDITKDRAADTSARRRGRPINRISKGIEYDSAGRKVAFHIYDAHPFDSNSGWTSGSTRVPADRVIHQYVRVRPSARIGVSWFAPLVTTNKDFDSLVANELTSRALGALLGVQVKSASGTACGFDDEDPDTGVSNFKMGYPAYNVTGLQDEIEVIESKRSTADNQPLQNLLINLHAMGCGISVNRLIGDPSKANLASLKAAHQDDDDQVAPIQQTITNRVVRTIRREHMRHAIAMGLFGNLGPSVREYQDNQYLYNEFTIVPSGRSDLDKDDGEAAIDRMRSGLSTFQRECARRGLHWRRVMSQMKKVGDEAERLGIVLDWTKGQGQVPDSATTIAGDEQKTGVNTNG